MIESYRIILRTNCIPFSSKKKTCHHRARNDRKKEGDEKKERERDTCIEIESGPRQIVADFPRVAAARETPTIYKRFEPGRIGEPVRPARAAASWGTIRHPMVKIEAPSQLAEKLEARARGGRSSVVGR